MIDYKNIGNSDSGLLARAKLNEMLSSLINGKDGVNNINIALVEYNRKIGEVSDIEATHYADTKAQILRSFDYTDSVAGDMLTYINGMNGGVSGFAINADYEPNFPEGKSVTVLGAGAGTYTHFLDSKGKPIVISDEDAITIFYRAENVTYWEYKSVFARIVKNNVEGIHILDVLTDVSLLPLTGTLGDTYIVVKDLYVYVGEGGNEVGGKYKNLGPLTAEVMYKTDLDLEDIQKRSNKVVTQKELDELQRIISNYKEGKITLIVCQGENSCYYGALNVSTAEDLSVVTLVFPSETGDLISYTLEGITQGKVWQIANKSSTVYRTSLNFISIVDGSQVTSDQNAEITAIMAKINQGVMVLPDASITSEVYKGPLLVTTSASGATLKYRFTIPAMDGKIYSYEYDPVNWATVAWSVTEIGGGGSDQIVKLTKAEYNALTEKDDVLYVIIG